MDAEQPIRILIADDHPVVRQGLAAIIETQPDMTVVAQAKNGREAVELFRRQRPHIALIDLKMPEMDGVETIIAIREEFPRAALLVLTTMIGTRTSIAACDPARKPICSKMRRRRSC